MAIRVLIADDHALVRAGLTMLLEAAPDIKVVAEAKDGREAVERAAECLPDVVLMDVCMPGTDGVAATREITSDGFPRGGTGDGGTPGGPGTVKVLAITTYHAGESVYAALRAGASGFLLKDAAPEEIVTAVRAVDAGDAYLTPGVTKPLLAEFAARRERTLPSPEELRQLTNREREVLALAARGMSNGEIAEHLFIAETTVKTHINRMLMKLGVRDRVQAVVAAYETGLVRPGRVATAPRGKDWTR